MLETAICVDARIKRNSLAAGLIVKKESSVGVNDVSEKFPHFSHFEIVGVGEPKNTEESECW